MYLKRALFIMFLLTLCLKSHAGYFPCSLEQAKHEAIVFLKFKHRNDNLMVTTHRKVVSNTNDVSFVIGFIALWKKYEPSSGMIGYVTIPVNADGSCSAEPKYYAESSIEGVETNSNYSFQDLLNELKKEAH